MKFKYIDGWYISDFEEPVLKSFKVRYWLYDDFFEDNVENLDEICTTTVHVSRRAGVTGDSEMEDLVSSVVAKFEKLETDLLKVIHGKLEEIKNDNIEDEFPNFPIYLEVSDLKNMLFVNNIYILNEHDFAIGFECLWDEEHGLEIVWNDNSFKQKEIYNHFNIDFQKHSPDRNRP